MSYVPGWRITRLEELCDINPPRPNLAGVADATDVLFVPMAAVDGGSGTIASPGRSTVGAVGHKSYRSFAPGDIIFAKITPCMENGKAAVVPPIPNGLGFGSTEFHVLRPKPGTNARLIWHLVRQRVFREEAAQHFAGTVGQLRVPAEFLKSFEVVVPADPALQARLADFLDAAVNIAASASARLARSERKVGQFRQAVLAAACSGRLTADWRADNDPGESASDLVARIELLRKSGRVTRSKPTVGPDGDLELPDRWTWTSVGALIDVATGATPLRTRAYYYGGSIPWVTSGAVNAGLITEATEFITARALGETNAKIFPPGTLLVAMYGEGQTRGRVAELGIAAATNQAVAALVFDQTNEALRDYIRLYFQENYERIRQLAFGGVQPNLSLGVIRDTMVPLPPIDEQQEIVRRVLRLSELANGIAGHVEAALGRADRTSQAILAKAFRGELLPRRMSNCSLADFTMGVFRGSD